MARGYYSQVFGPVLRSRLEGWREQDDVLDLRDELEVLRSIAVDAVSLYASALEGDADPAVSGRPGTPDSLLVTGRLVTQAIQNVREMAQTIARIEQIRGNLVTRDHLAVIARQLSQAAYEVFGEGDERTNLFLDRLSEVFFDPQTTHQVEPEKLVQMMLNTIPIDAKALEHHKVSEGNGNGTGNGNGQCS